MSENKKVSLKIENGKFIVEVDTNADGQPVIKIEMPLEEVLDELMALIKAKL